MEKHYNRTLYSRVKRLINIKISKSYRTPNEALCILTGNASIEIKAEEAANIYRITRDKQNLLLDHEAEQEDWTHTADSESVNITNQRLHNPHIHRW